MPIEFRENGKAVKNCVGASKKQQKQIVGPNENGLFGTHRIVGDVVVAFGTNCSRHQMKYSIVPT
jgi:hypothetical protein